MLGTLSKEWGDLIPGTGDQVHFVFGAYQVNPPSLLSKVHSSKSEPPRYAKAALKFPASLNLKKSLTAPISLGHEQAGGDSEWI